MEYRYSETKPRCGFEAGLGWDGWKTADLYTYEAIVFSETEFKKK